jgi:AraC-like DNA-binding protein
MRLFKKLDISYLDTDRRHDSEFKIDRPNGSGNFLFLHFYTPMKIGFRREDAITCPAGANIIYAPATPQWFKADGDKLVTDFIHFDAENAGRTLKKLALPLDRPFYMADSSFIASCIHQMLHETRLKELYWEDLLDWQLSSFLALLSRSFAASKRNVSMSMRRLELQKSFDLLREELQKSPERTWRVKKMAATLRLSEPYFKALYKSFFAISPIEDLLGVRMRYACHALLNNASSVKEVAQACGFNSVYYFSRKFKERMGLSPRAYAVAKNARSARKGKNP